MNRSGHLLPFVVASLALHAVLFQYRPADDVARIIRQPGDAGLQLILTRPAASAAVIAAPDDAVPPASPRPQRQDGHATPSPAPDTLAAGTAAAAAGASRSEALPDEGTQQAQTTDTAAGTPLQVQLLDALQPHFHYPLLARRRGWEGTVQVGLHVHADGRISDVRIIASSRHAVLDRAALDSLEHIGQLPGAVAWLNGHDSDIVLPVQYRLTDG